VEFVRKTFFQARRRKGRSRDTLFPLLFSFRVSFDVVGVRQEGGSYDGALFRHFIPRKWLFPSSDGVTYLLPEIQTDSERSVPSERLSHFFYFPFPDEFQKDVVSSVQVPSASGTWIKRSF